MKPSISVIAATRRSRISTVRAKEARSGARMLTLSLSPSHSLSAWQLLWRCILIYPPRLLALVFDERTSRSILSLPRTHPSSHRPFSSFTASSRITRMRFPVRIVKRNELCVAGSQRKKALLPDC